MKTNQPVVSIMKKLRSKIPRKKRFQISPILSGSSSNSLYGKQSVRDAVFPTSSWISDEISCTSNLFSSVGSEKFKSTQEKKKQVAVSETSSIVSEAISSPAVSQRKSKRDFKSEEDSCNDSAKKAKLSVEEIQGDNVSEISFVKSNQNQIVRDEIRAPATSTFSEISGDHCNVFAYSESTANQKPDDDIESDCKFEDYSSSYNTDEELSDYSMTISQLDSESFPRYSDVEVEYSDYTDESSIFDSESQTDFSEPEKSNPTAYFSFYLQYSKEFSRLSSAVSHSSRFHQEDSDELTFLRFEDEIDEDSYKKLRSRERNHVILNDYLDDYYSTTEYGNLVLQQRRSMVNWIIDESGVRQLNLETVFLGVSLLDRVLSQGFFQHKRKLQLLGIACLTLATRIEENQPYNCVRQRTIQIGSDVFSRCEVVAMEWLVQEILNFQCFLPTIYNFLWFYLKAARADEEIEDKAKYLAVLSLMDPELLCYWPSTVAAGLVILSALASNQDSSCQSVMETHLRTKTDDLPECIESLDWLAEYVC
ncbi:hypothetical protein MKW94_027967 [Papaver nudicaule]|uniref:Cyclin-like domain-containing protein n=1 Tax=Papaver nudicaule TaxID=74823 RepID=A0AA42AWV4_PAPNU|nr:hypothetical protein [Papaver nudicaule]